MSDAPTSSIWAQCYRTQSACFVLMLNCLQVLWMVTVVAGQKLTVRHFLAVMAKIIFVRARRPCYACSFVSWLAITTLPLWCPLTCKVSYFNHNWKGKRTPQCNFAQWFPTFHNLHAGLPCKCQTWVNELCLGLMWFCHLHSAQLGRRTLHFFWTRVPSRSWWVAVALHHPAPRPRTTGTQSSLTLGSCRRKIRFNQPTIILEIFWDVHACSFELSWSNAD